MRKMLNREHIEGYLYQHSLEIKTVQNTESANYGKEFIAGNVEVAVDDTLLNVIPVHFTYVTETTNNGTANKTFTALKKIIDEKKSIVEVGKDEAMKLKIDTALALNEFYNQQDELVSTKTNEGGFVTILNSTPLGEERGRNQFEVDMLINGINKVEANAEKGIEEHLVIKGAIFNFRNAILPVEFILKDKQGMEFFENKVDASPSNPVLKYVWGRINCTTSTVEVKEETAFGEAAVRSYERKTKEWLITGAKEEELEYGEGSKDLTPEELKQAIADRNTMLAELKQRSDEYKAQKAAGNIPKAKTTNVATGEFKF